MNDLLTVLISVTIAAFVGGITNHLAIKMLFHPRRPWYVGRRKVPFTPGLIPKRKEEIGTSLGKVVSDYLVTSHGMAERLNKPEFQEGLSRGLHQLLNDWAAKEETIAVLLMRWWTPEELIGMRSGLSQWLRGKTRESALVLWDKQSVSQVRLSELIPG